MAGTITVKGTGSVTAAPDYVVLSLTLEAHSMDYGETMENGVEQLGLLTGALCCAGFNKNDLKTVGFNVRTDYRGEQDEHGMYTNVFNGYVCTHQLELGFDMDSERLSDAIEAIAYCIASPMLSIRFTLKDSTAVKEELLASAAENARRKAEVLCRASGAALGKLVSISYDWVDLDIRSNTEMCMEDGCVAKGMRAAMRFSPNDIRLNDSAVFVWEIEN